MPNIVFWAIICQNLLRIVVCNLISERRRKNAKIKSSTQNCVFHASNEQISTKFCNSLHLTDFIDHSTFGIDQYGNFGFADVQSLPSPIGTCKWCSYESHSTKTQHCHCQFPAVFCWCLVPIWTRSVYSHWQICAVSSSDFRTSSSDRNMYWPRQVPCGIYLFIWHSIPHRFYNNIVRRRSMMKMNDGIN